jgi:micrococcal nuclease
MQVCRRVCYPGFRIIEWADLLVTIAALMDYDALNIIVDNDRTGRGRASVEFYKHGHNPFIDVDIGIVDIPFLSYSTWMRKLFLAFILSVFAFPAHAANRAPFQAIVAAIHDGDTFSVITPDHRWHKIRLASCDSPEEPVPGKWSKQPYADAATSALIHFIMGQTVTVFPDGTESYHRTVAAIEFKDVDVCEAMAREGLAWIDPRHDHNRMELYAAQDDAARHHRGIWASDTEPVPPWIRRRMSH